MPDREIAETADRIAEMNDLLHRPTSALGFECPGAIDRRI
jgi:hypothetical protein